MERHTAVVLICYLVLIGMWVTKRVIVAWLTFFALRRSPTFRKPSAQRWLWIFTLRTANGQRMRSYEKFRKRFPHVVP